MNEKNKIYDDKMTKRQLTIWMENLLQSVQGVQTHMYWISWQLITTEHQHRSSR